MYHIRNSHKDDANQKMAIKNVPYEVCAHCQNETANLWRHQKICSKKPELGKETATRPVVAPQQKATTGKSKADFIDAFEQRLQYEQCLNVKKTIPEYVRHLNRFISHEEDLDIRFSPWDWMASGEPNYRMLRHLSEYIAAFKKKQAPLNVGAATVDQMTNAYSKLQKWTLQEVAEQTLDPTTLLVQRGIAAKESRSLHRRRGVVGHGQGQKTSDVAKVKLDPEVIHRVVSI